jgi:hypothetical protein
VSNLEVAPAEVVGDPAAADGPALEVLAGREVVLGLRGDTVIRTLPHAGDPLPAHPLPTTRLKPRGRTR